MKELGTRGRKARLILIAHGMSKITRKKELGTRARKARLINLIATTCGSHGMSISRALATAEIWRIRIRG